MSTHLRSKKKDTTNEDEEYPDIGSLSTEHLILLSGSEDECDPWIRQDDPFAPNDETGEDDEDEVEEVHHVSLLSNTSTR